MPVSMLEQCCTLLSILNFRSWKIFFFFFDKQIDDHGPFNDLEVLKNKPGTKIENPNY